MITYKPLTKKIINQDGQQVVVCKYYGTDECRKIHKNSDGCNGCPMMAAVLNQLNVFEEIYLEEGDKNDT